LLKTFSEAVICLGALFICEDGIVVEGGREQSTSLMHRDSLGDIVGDDLVEASNSFTLDFASIIVAPTRLSGACAGCSGLILGFGGKGCLLIITHDHAKDSNRPQVAADRQMIEDRYCARRVSATKVKLRAIERKATRSHLGLNNGRWYRANEGVFVGITSCISGLRGTRKLSAPSC